ncbi:uncharacterized protein Dana_GF24747 [Drosophila ananassae]|uniref:Uncharacterized protein n=1 Tax=Drosophila ananassae TaxID=7217 RepID=B3M8Z4_DROAN|nr:uncharacterized protein LOC6507378 [Drosophila ananassae]EDV38938.1 uncharacterized protein Dana_GF24747 [Drosophila ananassae]
MVAYYDDCDATEHPKTLTDWVRNFRMKRQKMRRKLRGAGSDLRVNAILSTALFHAEHELRRKQQERFSRWLEMQTKFVPHGKTHCANDAMADAKAKAVEAEERREIENSLWRSELSGLDNFMRSLSGSSATAGNGNSSSSASSNNNNISLASNSYTGNNNLSCAAIAVNS